MKKLTLTYPTAMALAAIGEGHRYGFDIMDATGLPDGTVYPILRRLESRGYLRGDWEDEESARQMGRPARRYYELTGSGRRALERALDRYSSLARIFPGAAAATGGA